MVGTHGPCEWSRQARGSSHKKRGCPEIVKPGLGAGSSLGTMGWLPGDSPNLLGVLWQASGLGLYKQGRWNSGQGVGPWHPGFLTH